MTQTIVSIHGSPRRNGNSVVLAECMESEARAAGARVLPFYLHGMTIRPCSACDSCRASTEARCVVEDDMQSIYAAMKDADALIIASPIYWFAVSGQTKVFLDRCYALGGPEGTILQGKRVAIALTYEDQDAFRSGAVNALRSLQDMFAYVDAPIVGMVYGTALRPGEIVSNTKLLEEARELGRRLAFPA